MNTESIETFKSYVEARRPIIYINHFDTQVVDGLIREAIGDVKCLEFDNALGLIDFTNKSPMQECNLEQFLRQTLEDGYDGELAVVLRDVHQSLSDPKIIALLKRIAEHDLDERPDVDYQVTVFIVSEEVVIPHALENHITVFDIPLPSLAEIQEQIRTFGEQIDNPVAEEDIHDIARSCKGLNEFQINQILSLAYNQNNGAINKTANPLILKEKEQIIRKSGILEVINFTETIEEIGGLEELKDWLKRKARIFGTLDKAIRFGVDIPKGIMIVGMPGCGKSLTAKATAGLFELPLVRLDVGRLLGKYVGESESNMRRALRLAEAISPCVLWIDEIEKAFSGIGGPGGSDVTTRLFGQFLTWMQEKESAVFIVATANDISNLPPEFLRKGRFDEIFFVDLPNQKERSKILQIHLQKRGKWSPSLNMETLCRDSEGYNGADLEAAVKDAIEDAYINGQKTLTDQGLMSSIRRTKSISCTLKAKIQAIRKTVQTMDIRPASTAENSH